jgi:hypothetical protein
MVLAAVVRRRHGRLLMQAGTLGLGPERPSRPLHRSVVELPCALVVARASATAPDLMLVAAAAMGTPVDVRVIFARGTSESRSMKPRASQSITWFRRRTPDDAVLILMCGWPRRCISLSLSRVRCRRVWRREKGDQGMRLGFGGVGLSGCFACSCRPVLVGPEGGHGLGQREARGQGRLGLGC